MVPVLLGAVLVDEQVFESMAHANDAVSHLLDFAEPARSDEELDVRLWKDHRHMPRRTKICRAVRQPGFRQRFLRRGQVGWSKEVGLITESRKSRVTIYGIMVKHTDDLDLTVNVRFLLRRSSHHREGANTLAVETHVLEGIVHA